MNAPSLHQLADREAIRTLVLEYCRAIDRRDFGRLAGLYHPDATDDHGPYYSGPAAGFIAALPGIMAAHRMTAHLVTNHLIALDGDRAEGEVAVLALHQSDTEAGPADFLVVGRYLDRYVRAAAGWQFLHRRIVLDWSASGPSLFDAAAARAAGAVLGEPGAGDPSVAFLRLFARGA